MNQVFCLHVKNKTGVPDKKCNIYRKKYTFLNFILIKKKSEDNLLYNSNFLCLFISSKKLVKLIEIDRLC